MNKKRFTLAQNSLFNMLGTLFYYICHWVITMAIVRLSTDQNIGVFQLAMTISNTFVAIAHFNISTYQISDVCAEFQSGNYIASRLITCFISFILCIVYSLMWNYSSNIISCITIYMLYRCIECFADVLYAIDLKHARMDHVFISNVIKGFLMLIVFVLVIRISDNIVFAVSAMSIVILSIALLYDVKCASRYESIIPLFEVTKIKRILITCFPAMLGTVFFTAIVTITRQNLGKIISNDILGYYATVATPLVFVQVLINSLMGPSINEMSIARENKNINKFWKISRALCLIILGLGILVFLGVSMVGKFIMTLLYGVKIIPYIPLMYAVIGCTVAYAVCSVCFNVLIVLRRMKSYLFISAAALAIAILISDPLIRHFGADGVSYSILISYIVTAIASFVVIYFNVRKWDK